MGRYTDDIVLPGMLHGIVLRAPHAAAKVLAIDTSAARTLAGVHAIYTAADLKAAGLGSLPCAAPVQNRDGTDMASPPHPVLADGAVHHVGDPVAFIVADTAKQARDAAELVRIDYGILPSATDLATAMDAATPSVWPDVKNNTVFDWEIGDKTATDAAFAGAAHVTKLTVVNNRIVVASMEARAAIADYDATSGRWTLYANTQGGWLVKGLIGPLFNTVPVNFRVVTPDVGGGFGMKLFLYAEHVLTCFAARALGRPVKWAADRTEAFLCDTQGRATTSPPANWRSMPTGNSWHCVTRHYLQHGCLSVHLRAIYPDLCRHQRAVEHLRLQGDPRQHHWRVHQHHAGRRLPRPVPAGLKANYLVERLVDAAARELAIDRD